MRPCALAILSLLYPAILLATTIHVPSDQPTIQEGMSVSSPGDTVLISCGTYFENELHFPAGVIVRSEMGSADCVTIDAQQSSWIFSAQFAGTIRLEGLTLKNGGGGTHAGGLGLHETDAVVKNVVFENCSATLYGGATTSAGGGNIEYYDCVFRNCSAGALGGAYWTDSGNVLFERCVFSGNYAESNGGAIYGFPPVRILDCTIVGNSTGASDDITVINVTEMRNTIVAFNESAVPVVCFGSNWEVSCSNVFGNTGGDYTGDLLGQEGINGNISADPLFCDPNLDDFTLRNDSPCTPDNNDCGMLMGALPVACYAVGEIRIIVEPDEVGEASWSLYGPEGETLGAGDSVLVEMPAGEYEMQWVDVDGWYTPPSSSIMLTNGEEVTFTGQYIEIIRGSIIAWGNNVNGQCDVPEPNEEFTAIAAGYVFSIGLKSDSSIVAWGYNAYGQCDVPEPNTDFIAVARGTEHSLALKASGSIEVWGRNEFGQCDVPDPNSDFISVEGGSGHSLGLKSDGSVVAWGRNNYGQCSIPEPNTDFIAIAAGYYHSLGLKDDGSVVAWGNNDYDQLSIPEPNEDFIAISAGVHHGIALKADSTVVVWGGNTQGELNIPDPNSGFVAIAAGYHHSLALKSDSSIVAWGQNDFGQCDVPEPNVNYISIAGGFLHSLGMKRGSYFVAPDGSGDFSSIQAALDAVPENGTVKLGDGVFSGDGNRDLDFHGKGLRLLSENMDPASCLIDCQGTESEPHRGFQFQSGETSEAVIEGITIMGGYADEGGAIKCENGSSPTIRNCILRDNYASSGGALHSSESSNPQVEYTLIHSNEAATGGALFVENSAPTFSSCTISYNQAPLAGASFLLYSTPSFDNCILSHSIEGSAVFCIESNPTLTCTDVVWNEGGDWVGCIADQQNQNGNFSNTPAFCDPDNGDFRLQPGSPCLPEHNSCGVLVGALGEGNCSPTGAEDVPANTRVALSAFPNPFNPHLTIRFSLPAYSQGSLIVHDVSGRQVRVLKDGQLAKGANEFVWNGRDDHGQEVASGVYFVRLVSDEYQESKKVVLLR